MYKKEKLKQKIFISYAWNDNDVVSSFIEKLKERLDNEKVNIIQDNLNLSYKGSINDLMNKDGLGKYVILLISEKYLKSQNCMFEFNEILRSKKFNNRCIPLITKDANLFSEEKRLKYVNHWDGKINELDHMIQSFEGDENELNTYYYSLNMLSNIRNNVAHNLENLGDMMVLEIDENHDNTIEVLLKAIDTKLKLDIVKSESDED